MYLLQQYIRCTNYIYLSNEVFKKQTNLFFYNYTDKIFWLEKLNEIAKNNPSVCPRKCGRKFGGCGRKANLKLHLIKECGIYLHCPLCTKTFGHKRSLKYHMGAIHKIISDLENWNIFQLFILLVLFLRMFSSQNNFLCLFYEYEL